MKRILSATYKIYTTGMSGLADVLHLGHSRGEKSLAESADQFADKDFEDLDKEATTLGNAYRGIGVIIAILGALIIFSAIVPVAFDLHGASYWFFGVTEVLAMLLVVALVTYAKKSRLHTKWRDTRRAAENKRYEHFSTLIEKARTSPTSENTTKLLEEAVSHLEGENSQIDYNLSKSRTYHKIETLSGKLGWGGFALALIGALGHLSTHWNGLLILTVFVPALVGALHGLNSFLKLDDLAYDHKSTADQLTKLKTDITHSVIESNQEAELIDTAESIYHTLVSRDKQWADKIGTQNLQAT